MKRCPRCNSLSRTLYYDKEPRPSPLNTHIFTNIKESIASESTNKKFNKEVCRNCFLKKRPRLAFIAKMIEKGKYDYDMKLKAVIDKLID